MEKEIINYPNISCLQIVVYKEFKDIGSEVKINNYLIYCDMLETGKEKLRFIESTEQHDEIVNGIFRQLLNTILDQKVMEIQDIVLLEGKSTSVLERDIRKSCKYVLMTLECRLNTDSLISLKKALLRLQPMRFIDSDEVEQLLGLKDLPVSNLHHGLVYAHISGFMGYVIEELQKHLPKKCEEYEKEEKRLIDKILLVIPETCEVPWGMVTSKESASICISTAFKAGTVSTVDEISFQRKHVGKERMYKVTIYKIKSENEEYYICAQVPTILTAISQLAQKHLGEIDVGLEKQRLHLLYQQILDLKGWNDTVKLVSCKDEADIPRALFDAAKELGTPNKELSESQAETAQPDAQQVRVFLRYFKSESDQAVGQVGGAIRSDRTVAEDIEQMLEKEHIQTCTSLAGEGVLESEGNHEGWVIFVLSKAAIEDPVFSFNMISSLQTDVDKCKLRVMLVLIGLQISDVPHCIKWVRFFHVTEEKTYLNGILRTFSDAPVDISKAIPAGDVIPGLAWAYVQNYLMKTLTNTLGKRIKTYLNEKQIECGCIQTLILVWVKSCNTEQWLTELANKGVHNRQVEHLKGDLAPTFDEFGGQIGRPFNLNVFKYTDTRDPNNKFERCFLAEYLTPMQCIKMLESDYAGMSSAAMEEQGPRFKDILDEIMSRKTIQDIFGESKVSMIYFDDLASSPEKSLIDLLDEEIRDFPTVINRQ